VLNWMQCVTPSMPYASVGIPFMSCQSRRECGHSIRACLADRPIHALLIATRVRASISFAMTIRDYAHTCTISACVNSDASAGIPIHLF
jgi:hypothetical protein